MYDLNLHIWPELQSAAHTHRHTHTHTHCLSLWLQDKMYDLNFKVQPNDGSQKRTPQQLLDLYKEFCTKVNLNLVVLHGPAERLIMEYKRFLPFDFCSTPLCPSRTPSSRTTGSPLPS